MSNLPLQRCGHCSRFYLEGDILEKCTNCGSVGEITIHKQVPVVELWGVYVYIGGRKHLARVCTDKSIADLLAAEYKAFEVPIISKVIKMELYNEY